MVDPGFAMEQDEGAAVDSMGVACALCVAALSLALALRMIVDPRVRDLLNLCFAAMAIVLGVSALLDAGAELFGWDTAVRDAALGAGLVVVRCALLLALLGLLLVYLWLRFQQTSAWHTGVVLLVAMAAYGVTCVTRTPAHALLGVVCACALLLVFMDLRSRREAELAEREAQIARSRADAVLSQIQPHFLYNTLAAIRGLCRQDPRRAQETLEDFSVYLRGNMASLQRRLPIPLVDELRHTDKYLELERLRFGDRLRVEYDVRDAEFELPALTIQTLAENAVRHGISRRPGGGTLRIATELREGVHLVVIEDDGVGFNVATLEGLGDEHVDTGGAGRRAAVGVRLAAACAACGAWELACGMRGREAPWGLGFSADPARPAGGRGPRGRGALVARRGTLGARATPGAWGGAPRTRWTIASSLR